MCNLASTFEILDEINVFINSYSILDYYFIESS